MVAQNLSKTIFLLFETDNLPSNETKNCHNKHNFDILEIRKNRREMNYGWMYLENEVF